jgi:hypothetical protein
MRNLSFILIFIVLIPLDILGQPVKSTRNAEIVLELPVIDLPYQIDAAKTVNEGDVTFGSFFKGYANPGMHLSLSISSDLYTGAHLGISQLFNPDNKLSWTIGKRFWYGVSLIGADFLMEYLPGFDGWEHEEYHRAILSRFHINSFNDILKFRIGAETVNVSHVADQDLVRFKLESPADFVRSEAAGIEGEYLLVERLQRNNFFYSQHLPHEVLYLIATLNSIFYVQTCSNPSEADRIIDESNAEETAVEARDFTGLDFLSWTYDLFRPGEPYEARGIHPSGTGIDRYIKTTDLTSEEMSYLKQQGKLQWFNVVSPMMIGFKRIRLTQNGLYGNFAFRDYLTSFGNDISFNVFLMNPEYKLVFAYHNFQNYERFFPAIEIQMIDILQPLFSSQIYISPRIFTGMQPLDQGFKTGKAAFLGMAECRLELKTKSVINPFVELSAKTKGWIPGNEYLNENISFRAGLSSRFGLKGSGQYFPR